MVAAMAEAVMGPKPGMLISRRAVSSFCASFAIVRSSRAIASSRFRNCTTSGASASHTSNGIVSSQASTNSASPRACLGPCAAMTPTSVKWPRSPLSSCVRCERFCHRNRNQLAVTRQDSFLAQAAVAFLQVSNASPLRMRSALRDVR